MIHAADSHAATNAEASSLVSGLRRPSILLVCTWLCVAMLMSGCASQRYKARYQAEVDAMRAEYFELEDRYYETLGELETTQRRLNRALRASGQDPEDPALDAPMDDAPMDEEPTTDSVPNPMSDEGDGSVLPMPADDPTPSDMPPQSRTIRRGQGSGIAQRPSMSRPSPDELPHPTRRDYEDPIESAEERNARHAAEAAEDGLPYFANTPDERGLAAPQQTDNSILGNVPVGPAVTGTPNPDLAWQEPLTVNPEVINDWNVTRVSIDTTKSRGYDSDGVIGDEGVVLVVHPLNAAGQSIPVFAPMKVSIIDPASEGEAQRVGLWEFTAEELEYRQPPASTTGQGITIRLPWAHGTPRHSRVIVFVRYEAPDAGQVETKQEIVVELGSADRSAWSTRNTPLRTVDQTPTVAPRGDSPSVPRPGNSVPARQVSESNSPRTGRPAWSPHR